MEKNNFEKEVQEKMKELSIQPSEKAWEGIESRIGKKDSRRRILWFLLIGFFLLAGGVYMFVLNLRVDENQIAHLPGLIVPLQPKDETDIKKDLTKFPSNSTPLAGIEGKPGTIHKNPEITKYKLLAAGSGKHKKTHLKSNFSEIDRIVLVHPGNTFVESPKPSDKQPGQKPPMQDKTKPENEAEIIKEMEEGIAAQTIINQEKVNLDSLPVRKNSEVDHLTNITHQDILTQNNADKEIQDQIIDESKTSGRSKTVSAVNKKWKVGFALNLSKAFLGDGIRLGLDEQKYSSDLSFSSPGNLPGLSNGTPQIAPPITPVNSIGFNAGIMLEKKIFSKTVFVTGLGYKYYANAFLIGEQLPSGDYYSGGYLNSYRNNFHFLELPILIDFRLRHTRKIPFTVSTGFTVSQLIVSNAVQYKNGFYKVDNSLFNKTQFGFSVGISATLFKKISLGPFYNYGVNSLAKEGLYKNKHLNLLGIKASLLFDSNK